MTSPTTLSANTASQIFKFSALAISISLLAACGSGTERKKPYESDSSGTKHEHDGHKDNDKYHIDTMGRLAVAHEAGNKVSFVELDDGKLAGTLTSSQPISALHASPEKRFAMAFSRDQHRVEIFDGGLYQEDHGEHLHDYKKTPTKIALGFDRKKPTHYEVHDEHGAIFFDGDGKADPKVNSSIAVLSDESILGLAPKFLELPNAMHGTAEPREDYLLTTKRNTDTTVLPDQVVLYKLSDGAYKLQKTFANNCPMLHGSYSNETYTVFGCSKHVLGVSQNGDTFSDMVIDNPSDLKGRIGSFVGNHEVDVFIGFASGQPYVIDPAAKSMTKLNWTTDTDAKVATAKFDAEGEHLLILDNKGMLSVHEVADGFKQVSKTKVFDKMPEAKGHSHPALEVGHAKAEGMAYLLDTSGDTSQLVSFTIESAKVTRVPLTFKAKQKLVWLGIAGHEEHDHEHKEGEEHKDGDKHDHDKKK